MKPDKANLIWSIANFAAAIAIGVLTTFWIEGTTSFLVGVIAYLCAEMLRSNLWAAKIHDQYQRIASAMEVLKRADDFTDLLLLYGLRQRGWLDKETVHVDRDEVRRFWRDCIGRANGRWSVVTYASPEETWLLAWRQNALAIQKERIMSGCVIERVFVVDSQAEWDSLKSVVKEQIETGISVSWVLHKDVVAQSVASEAAKRLGTMDVAVADDAWVYKTYLTRGRDLKGASASRDAEAVETARAFVREVRGLAAVVTAIP